MSYWRRQTREIRHVFLMTGAVPNTRWVKAASRSTTTDSSRPVRTFATELADAQWPLARRPIYSNRPPWLFAVGDVRGGNIKRVASAVGEGSIAVAFVHQALRE